jgi:hypothetical protein
VQDVDAQDAEGKIVHRRDGFGHQALIPIALREPKSAVALWIVYPRAQANIPDRLAITATQHQHPIIDHFPRRDPFQFPRDESHRAVFRIRPGNDLREMLDDIPVVEMALDRRRI